MSENAPAVGIDVGSLYLKAVRLDAGGCLAGTFYRRHRGEIEAVFAEALQAVHCRPGDRVGITGSAAHRIAEAAALPVLDHVRCLIQVVRREHPGVVEILDVGGGSCSLIQLTADGQFQGYSSNSLCAAGTGSFLDEQASRLGISFEQMASFAHVADPPSIAARCSVFAKSDLIHRQQEGYSKPAMWSGLCRGMTRTMLATLLSGRPLGGKAAVVGGVALNQTVLHWVREQLGELIIVPDAPHLAAARGAALLGEVVDTAALRVPTRAAAAAADGGRHAWPLTLEKSTYPSFACRDSFVDEHGSEVRILTELAPGSLPVYLGIDIGSTSTKVAIVDQSDRVVADIYRKTAGDPLLATKLIFKAMREVAGRCGIAWDIRGAGTTGSGRAMVGQVIGADAIINEITAHVAGAVKFDPTIDTIFEIGGQDSKYMHVVDGHIRDANMNYVCAAGTGSFVEEQANKLGYSVADVGSAVLGVTPPRASDRCTVFMEQDVTALVQAGSSREEALAAVMVAVVKNYLNKVVGNRYRSRRKIFFQGATARNQALVAAFERLLDVQMVVSPYCHVMGSYGVALLTRRAMQEQGKQRSSLRGLDLDKREVKLRKETCSLCQNDCTITTAAIEGVEPDPSWGYMCGRDPEEKRMRTSPRARYLRLHQKLWREGGRGAEPAADAPVVGIPRGLSNFTFAPMWRRFFNELGYRVQLSPPTNATIRDLGGRLAGAEFCFPAKAALGHVAHLLAREEVSFVFVPQLGNERAKPEVNAATYCPYVQAWPATAKSALMLNDIGTERILSPLIDKRLPERRLVDRLVAALARPLGRTAAQIAEAWQRACAALQDFERRCYEAGDAALREARDSGERLLVLIGRPYNTADSGLNLDLPHKIAERGLTLLPMDLIRPDLSRLGQRYRNVYWAYGQKILAVLDQVAASDCLDAVYLTNFCCGPDSFLLSYAEEIMGNRPFLALELDEHGGDAGYLTRVEAFLDVLRRPRGRAKARVLARPAAVDFRRRTLWIPPMHEFGADFFAAAFRRHGYDARPLPPENAASFELGRSLTRGSECLPTALTIGALITTLREAGLRAGQAFLMPTACGPCRFGQYCQLHRQILDREGYADVAILSPSSINAYHGVDDALRRSLFKAIVASDILLKARCKVRPYELTPGLTNRVVAREAAALTLVIAEGGDLRRAIRGAVTRVAATPRASGSKPCVGVVGEIYVRNNPFSNENLLAAIEAFGGEAWPSPMAEWIMFLASPRNFAQYLNRRIGIEGLKSYLTYRWQRYWDRALYDAAGPLLSDRHEPDVNDVLDEAAYYMERNIGGEAMLILGRSIRFAHDGAAMVVNCAPFGCMPGAITTAISRHIAAANGMPVVNMFYDGQGNQNRRLAVYLNNAIQLRPHNGAPARRRGFTGPLSLIRLPRLPSTAATRS